MKPLQKTMRIRDSKCPPECSICLEKCLERFQDAECSAIKVIHLPEEEAHAAVVCNQCGEPVCEACCPVGAISKAADDGIVRIDRAKCLGCGLCSMVCPYGGIEYNAHTKRAVKCDGCDGDPECVKVCPEDILSCIDNESVTGYFRIDDPLSHGTAMCPGCPAEIAHRFTMRILGKDVVLIGAPGCASAMMLGVEAPGGGIKDPETVPSHMALLTNVASVMTGMKRYYDRIGKDVTVVSFVGDGATADVGFQALSGAAERGENILYVCYDNEAYMNTGIQRSGTTPMGAWTSTTQVGPNQAGKSKPSKYIPLLMALHGGVSYTATATIAHPLDYARKLKKAMEVKDGMVYIHIFSPCPVGWRGADDGAIEMCEAAVETDYFPLWEAEKGVFRLTHRAKLKKPVQEFTRLTDRFRHLDEKGLEGFQKMVDERMTVIQKLAG